METDRLVVSPEEKESGGRGVVAAAFVLSLVFLVGALSSHRSLKQAPISMYSKKKMCVGHAALESLQSFSAISTPSKKAYTDRFDYDLVVLEATTRWKLGQTFCPALAGEVTNADERTALRYCFMWHALKVRGCEWALWTDPEVLIASEQPLQVSSETDAIWFTNDDEEEDGSCGTPDHFASVVDPSVFMLRNNRWVDGFVHYKLAFGNMDASALKNSRCLEDAESPSDTTRINEQCADNSTSLDQCTTGCLYRYRPDWLEKAKCRRRDPIDDIDHALRDNRDQSFFTYACEHQDNLRERQDCLRRAASTLSIELS